MSASPKPVRCAVYTRKSTEHNLDLQFNSLHAQREACEAYILSQKHEGWRLVPDCYDDGGLSGGTLDRPDLKRLLVDIGSGKIDTVVVYKVDRLTRSLTDFAKLVELFDRHGVSFVSVTQAFNTTTSMGRLTLNVLLSFAQFEREVIGERVRDKIAASKRKGLWMGGNPPLGYINQDKKLVIVPEQAEQVRWIFRRYLELGSLGQLIEEMAALGIKSRVKTLASGRERGGGGFSKGALAYLLKNRSYVGEIFHQGAVHSADHDVIIDRETFDAVQAALAAKTVERGATSKGEQFLLAGLIFDSAGNRMTPSFTRKKGVRYRYYISQAILQSRKAEAGRIGRVAAPDIEQLIANFCRKRSPRSLVDVRSLVDAHIAKITVGCETLEITLVDTSTSEADRDWAPQKIVSLPWSKKAFPADKGIAMLPTAGPEAYLKARDTTLAAIGRACVWVADLMSGGSLAEIARQESKTERHIRLLMPLAFLPPAAVKAIIDGRSEPITVTSLAAQVPVD